MPLVLAIELKIKVQRLIIERKFLVGMTKEPCLVLGHRRGLVRLGCSEATGHRARREEHLVNCAAQPLERSNGETALEDEEDVPLETTNQE